MEAPAATLHHSAAALPCPANMHPCWLPCRLTQAALVNKQLHALCLAPQLLHTIDVQLIGFQVIARLQSLLEFLMRLAAPHLHRLMLCVAAAPQRHEAAALVASCMGVLSAAGQLEELMIDGWTPLATTAWLPGLTALRRLQLGSSEQALSVSPGINRLVALECAELAGGPLELGGACLPSGLTSLCLKDTMAQVHAMPHQERCGSGVVGAQQCLCHPIPDLCQPASPPFALPPSL